MQGFSPLTCKARRSGNHGEGEGRGSSVQGTISPERKNLAISDELVEGVKGREGARWRNRGEGGDRRPLEKTGKERVEREGEKREKSEIEAGLAEAGKKERPLLSGWEYIRLENPWTRETERLRVSRGGRQAKGSKSSQPHLLGREGSPGVGKEDSGGKVNQGKRRKVTMYEAGAEEGWGNPTVWESIELGPWNPGYEDDHREGVPLLSPCPSKGINEETPLKDSSLLRTAGLNPFTPPSVNPFFPTLGKEGKLQTLIAT